MTAPPADGAPVEAHPVERPAGGEGFLRRFQDLIRRSLAARLLTIAVVSVISLVIMGWMTMRHRPRTVGDPVADDREHRVTTHLHYASSSFFITVFNPLTVMAFGAAFASAFLVCGPRTMIMLRPSCLGADSTNPSSVTSSASFCSSR